MDNLQPELELPDITYDSWQARVFKEIASQWKRQEGRLRERELAQIRAYVQPHHFRAGMPLRAVAWLCCGLYTIRHPIPKQGEKK
jgi:hypothetical protein